MNTYIGTKMLLATPMTRGEYNMYRGWNTPINELGADPGYLVEYEEGPPNHENHSGYISWSPKEIFEDAYQNLGLIEGFPGYQKRVIGEAAQLRKKLHDLQDFINSTEFMYVYSDEQQRMKQQAHVMVTYLTILDSRIANFNH